MIDVKQTLSDAEERMEMAAMYLEEQLVRIRAGRANVALLDGVEVNPIALLVPPTRLAPSPFPAPVP